MAKTKQQKFKEADFIKEGLENYPYLIICDFAKINVSDIVNIRNEIKKSGGVVKVLKKTVFKKVIDKFGITGFDFENYKGSMMVFFGSDLSIFKLIDIFAKKNDNLKIVTGILENKFINFAEIKMLANLPTKEILLSRLLSAMQAPIAGFVNVINSPIRKLVFVLSHTFSA